MTKTNLPYTISTNKYNGNIEISTFINGKRFSASAPREKGERKTTTAKRMYDRLLAKNAK